MKIIVTAIQASTGSDVLEFVEVEDNKGNSINVGEWTKDGPWQQLRISTDALITALGDELLELEHRNALEQLLASQTTPKAWQRLTPEEVVVLDAYRRNRPALVAGESVHLLLTVDSDHRSTLVQCDTKEAVPSFVYYNGINFYDARTKLGMGEAFYYKWKDRAREFPFQSPTGSDGRDHPHP